jgi:hypothetical protein
MLFYRAALPLSPRTLRFVSGLIRVHRKELGSVWCKLGPGRQALLVLVHLRKGEPFAEVGAGFEVSTTTCWRYVNETVELLTRRAPKLRAALRTAKRHGHAYVVIDGTLIPIDRIAADRPFYSGKHKSSHEQPGASPMKPRHGSVTNSHARPAARTRHGCRTRRRCRVTPSL